MRNARQPPRPLSLPHPPPISPAVGSGKCKTILEHRAPPGSESLAPSCRPPVVVWPHIWRRAPTIPPPPRRGCRVRAVRAPCRQRRTTTGPAPGTTKAPGHEPTPHVAQCAARHDRPRATPRAPGADVPPATTAGAPGQHRLSAVPSAPDYDRSCARHQKAPGHDRPSVAPSGAAGHDRLCATPTGAGP